MSQPELEKTQDVEAKGDDHDDVASDASPQTTPPPEGALPPEGGLQGWLCVLGGFLALNSTFGFLTAVGVFQTYYQANTLSQYTASDISWIFAVQLSLMWFPGPLFGRIVDTYGPKPVIIPCSILCVFAICMTSLATEYYQIFLAQGLAFGIGAGGCFTTAATCVGQWFVRWRGTALGVMAVGSCFGGVFFPIFFDRVIPQVGFYGSLRYSAILMGVPLVAACALITSRMPRKKWDRETKWFDYKLFLDIPFSAYSAGCFFVMWGLWAPYDFLPGMAEATGVSPSLSLYLISMINATSIIGRLVPAYISDHIGHFNVMSTTLFATAVSMLALWLPFSYHHSHAGLIVFALVFGVSSGAVFSLIIPCAAKAGTIDKIGQRFGTFQTVIGVAMLTGLPIQGAILNLQGGYNYTGLQIFAIVAGFIGFGLVALATVLFGKQYRTRRV